MVSIYSSSRYKVNKQKLKKAAEYFLTKNEIPSEKLVNIILVGRNKMKTIAKKYKNEKVALPVLSFLYDKKIGPNENDNLFGEILICYSQAVLLAAEREKTVEKILTQLIEHAISNLSTK